MSNAKDSRMNSIGHQLLNHGIGVVSSNAAEKIARAVPQTPRIVEDDVLINAVSDLAKAGEIEVLTVGGQIALE